MRDCRLMAMHPRIRLAPLPFVLLLLVACTGTIGASPTPGSSASPTPGSSASPTPSPSSSPAPTTEPNAGVAIVRIENVGGFMPPQMIWRRYPDVVLYGDGRLITQGPQVALYPGPALPSLIVTQLSPHGMEQILEWAREAGLFGPDRMLGQPIPDAGMTNFTIVYPDGTHTTSLSPGFDGNSPDPDIAAVQQFEQVLLAVRTWLPDDVVGDDAPYAWTRLWIIANPADPQNLPDPQFATEKDWPLGSLATLGAPMTFGDGYRCAVIDGAELQTLRPLLVEANELTLWRSEGQLYQAIFHPMLPDDETCPWF